MGGFLFGDVAWSPFAGHGGSWRDGAAAGGFPRAGRAVWGVLEWFRGGWRSFGCPGGLVGEGDDGRGGAGDRVLRTGVAERAGRLGLARAVPVPAGDGAVSRDLPGQRLVAGPSGPDCGAGAAARAASRVTPRVISVEAAQAAISWAIRAGLPERSIAPVPGPAPCSGAFASRSPVSDPSHRHL